MPPLTIAESKKGDLALPRPRRNLAASAEPVETDDVVVVDGWYGFRRKRSQIRLLVATAQPLNLPPATRMVPPPDPADYRPNGIGSS